MGLTPRHKRHRAEWDGALGLGSPATRSPRLRETPVWGQVFWFCMVLPQFPCAYLGCGNNGHGCFLTAWDSALGQALGPSLRWTRGFRGTFMSYTSIAPWTEWKRGLAGCHRNKTKQILPPPTPSPPPQAYRGPVAMTSSAHQPCAVGGPVLAGELQHPMFVLGSCPWKRLELGGGGRAEPRGSCCGY